MFFVCIFKIWRTKASEESWNRHVERKRIEQINTEKQRQMANSKRASRRRRTNSRGSISSISNAYSRQQPLTANPQTRSNRSLSRVSFHSANNIDQLKSLKPIHQGSLESLADSVRSGIHVEFKLSTQIDENKQQQQLQIQALNEQRG